MPSYVTVKKRPDNGQVVGGGKSLSVDRHRIVPPPTPPCGGRGERVLRLAPRPPSRSKPPLIRGDFVRCPPTLPDGKTCGFSVGSENQRQTNGQKQRQVIRDPIIILSLRFTS